MQPLILVLFIGLFLHDALVAESSDFPLADWDMPWILILMLLPKLLFGVLYHWRCRRVFRMLGEAQSHKRLKGLERFTRILSFLLMASYLLDLALGGLEWLRRTMGDMVIVDELLLMLPSLLTVAWMWWSYYPIDRAMRESAFIGRLDQGKPVQIWTRMQFMIANVRHQWVLLGVPMLLLTTWTDVVRRYIGPMLDWSETNQQLLTTGGALVVFTFMSVLIRHLWDTVPLPEGELRRSLIGMCKQYRVRVRELLLWRTFGGLVNGAVMGVFGWVRYILLTDALLDSLSPKQVQAVMAHELAHVRKHHMFWMVVIAGGSLELLRLIWTNLFTWSFDLVSTGTVGGALPDPMVSVMQNPNMRELSGVVVSIACWFFLFGWVSRRFERQADTFAVQHMAREHHAHNENEIREGQSDDGGTAHGAEPIVITPAPASDAWVSAMAEGRLITSLHEPVPNDCIPHASSYVMIDALQAVADLNCVPTTRSSWRHGSIKWRQDYLRELAGSAIDGTAIDRQVLWIKVGGVVGLAVLVLNYLVAG